MLQSAVTAAPICDPVTIEVVRGALQAALNEMGALLERTAMSAVVREKKDYLTAFYDADTRMVAGTLMPLFGKVLDPVLVHYPLKSMRSGDIYWYNDVYASQGAVTHSNDQIMISPVFAEDQLCGFVQCWAHIADIGGMYPGSISAHATSIYQEGIIVPPIQLAREGVLDEDLLRFFERNTRFPDEVRGDMRSLMAALALGGRRFLEIVERFGRDRVLDGFRQLQDRTEARARELLHETFAPGSYEFSDVVDTDGHGHGPFRLRLKMDVSDNGITIDTRETDDQAQGPINYLMHPVVPSLILGIYLMSKDAPELMNDGLTRLIDEVKLRPGSILQPQFPAAVGQRSLTWLRLQSTVMGLVNVASGGDGLASNPAYSVCLYRGIDPQSGEPFMLSDGVAVGYGARSFSDGIDGVYYIAQENYPAEFIDSSYPLRLRKYAMRMDGGGPGRWRGGCGVVREFEILADEVMLALRIDSTVNTPWGVAGGQSGRPGMAVINPGTPDEKILPPLADGIILRRGDVFRLETGGGGGHGHPFDRSADQVRLDVLRGFVSIESAADDYGIALIEDEAGPRIDIRATQVLRAKRQPTKFFHRHHYLDRI